MSGPTSKVLSLAEPGTVMLRAYVSAHAAADPSFSRAAAYPPPPAAAT